MSEHFTNPTTEKADESASPGASQSHPFEDPAASEHNPIGEIRETLNRVQSRSVIAILSLYALSGTTCMAILMGQPVRDWYLFLAMYLLIFVYVIAYLKAHQRKLRTLRFVSLMSAEVLMIFWAFILIDRIPARRVFVDGQVLERPMMEMLWLPVGLLGLVGIGLFVHWAALGRNRFASLEI